MDIRAQLTIGMIFASDRNCRQTMNGSFSSTFASRSETVAHFLCGMVTETCSTNLDQLFLDGTFKEGKIVEHTSMFSDSASDSVSSFYGVLFHFEVGFDAPLHHIKRLRAVKEKKNESDATVVD